MLARGPRSRKKGVNEIEGRDSSHTLLHTGRLLAPLTHSAPFLRRYPTFIPPAPRLQNQRNASKKPAEQRTHVKGGGGGRLAGPREGQVAAVLAGHGRHGALGRRLLRLQRMRAQPPSLSPSLVHHLHPLPACPTKFLTCFLKCTGNNKQIRTQKKSIYIT